MATGEFETSCPNSPAWFLVRRSFTPSQTFRHYYLPTVVFNNLSIRKCFNISEIYWGSPLRRILVGKEDCFQVEGSGCIVSLGVSSPIWDMVAVYFGP